MLIRSHTKTFVALAVLCALSGTATAQSSPKPYTLDDVIAFVQNDVPATRVVSMAKNACINFKVTDSIADRLRNAGANDALIDGLRSACYKGASSKDVEVPTRRVNPPAPRVVVRHDTVVVPRERVVVKHDTVVVQRPLVTPPVVTPTVVPASSTSLDWDFRSSQPLSAGRFGKCQYDYSSAGYTISIAENGSPCLDGAPNEWDSNVRISTTATPISGSPGYNYGTTVSVRSFPSPPS